MAKHDIVVIGAGLFGSIAATLARQEGHNVTVVDAAFPWAASKASGCVLAPSWLTALTSDEIAAGMDVLRSLYAVHEVEFHTNLVKTFKAHRVVTKDVLVQPDVLDEVVSVKTGSVMLRSGDVHRGKVLIAAGINSSKLLPQIPPVRALWGASLLVPGQLPEPRIHVYAPYRQAVAFNMDKKRVWMGDGTALVAGTWEKKHEEYINKTCERAEKLFGLDGHPARPTAGARPYMEGHKKGFFEKVLPGVWCATGGAKNGTLLAALHARQFLKELK